MPAATSQQLSQVADSLVDAARKQPELANVVSTFRGSVPAYNIHMDLDKLQTLGVPVTDAYNALQTFLGGLYVNDFNRFGHTWQVLIQAEPEFRNRPSDIDRFYVRTDDGNMVPLGTLRVGHAQSPAPTWCSAITASARFRFSAARAGRQFRPSHRRDGEAAQRKRCRPVTAMNGPAPPISRSWRRGTKA